MADSNYWRDLRSQFEALSLPFDFRAGWGYEVGNDRLRWSIAAPEAWRVRFENLAQRAGAAVSNSADADSLQTWLDLLSPGSKMMSHGEQYTADGTRGRDIVFGSVSNVCGASANLCVQYETAAFEAQRQRESNPKEPAEREAGLPPSAEHPQTETAATGNGGRNAGKPQFPMRASWLKDRLRERSWNKHDLSRYGGLDHKTIQKILNGVSVREDVLQKVANGLSKHGDKVTVLDIPQH